MLRLGTAAYPAACVFIFKDKAVEKSAEHGYAAHYSLDRVIVSFSPSLQMSPGLGHKAMQPARWGLVLTTVTLLFRACLRCCVSSRDDLTVSPPATRPSLAHIRQGFKRKSDAHGGTDAAGAGNAVGMQL